MTVRTWSTHRADGYGPKADAGAGDLERMDEALKWIRGTASDVKSPWVLAINIDNPHFPHFAQPEFWEMYPGEGDLPEYGTD